MATDRPTEALPNGKSGGTVEDDTEDFKPSAREALHTDPELCRKTLDRVTSSVPLAIRSSNISMGSGLFVTADIDAGQEIYNVNPMMDAVDAGNDSYCHYCLEDTQDALGGETKSTSQIKPCTGCKVARFCSKKCQKSAWFLFHKDECKILQKAPQMSAQHLMAHRFLFWQQRGFITTQLAESLARLETHFKDYSDDPDRASELMDIAMAVRDGTGRKVSLKVTWRLVPAMRINCVRLRPASKKESIGYTFDVTTAMINHSCDPNAFVLFEGRKVHVRSLKKIAAGEEITISYLDPTLHVSTRRNILKSNWFFDCYCSRCKSELREERTLLGGSTTKLPALHSAQREIVLLIRKAIQASNYPGIYPEYEDMSTVETKLRTIMANALPASSDKSWPEHMEPLPSARLSLAMIALKQGKPVPALRNVLRGKFLTTRQIDGPEWVNEMMDVVTVLMVGGSLPPDAAAFEDKSFPAVEDIRTVTYGYLWAMVRGAERAFGKGVGYVRVVRELMGAVLGKKKGGAAPGSREFWEREFEAAQGKVLGWAGVPVERGVKVVDE